MRVKFVAARRVGDDDYSTGEQAQGDKPFLSIIETVIYEGDARPCQHLSGVSKVKAMLRRIGAVLCFISFVYHPTQ
jgi:hypothetical protein